MCGEKAESCGKTIMVEVELDYPHHKEGILLVRLAARLHYQVQLNPYIKDHGYRDMTLGGDDQKRRTRNGWRGKGRGVFTPGIERLPQNHQHIEQCLIKDFSSSRFQVEVIAS